MNGRLGLDDPIIAFHLKYCFTLLDPWPFFLAYMAIDLALLLFQDNLNLLLTEEEMYSLTETFQQCKVIPGKAGWYCQWRRLGRFLLHTF